MIPKALPQAPAFLPQLVLLLFAHHSLHHRPPAPLHPTSDLQKHLAKGVHALSLPLPAPTVPQCRRLSRADPDTSASRATSSKELLHFVNQFGGTAIRQATDVEGTPRSRLCRSGPGRTSRPRALPILVPLRLALHFPVFRRHGASAAQSLQRAVQRGPGVRIQLRAPPRPLFRRHLPIRHRARAEITVIAGHQLRRLSFTGRLPRQPSTDTSQPLTTTPSSLSFDTRRPQRPPTRVACLLSHTLWSLSFARRLPQQPSTDIARSLGSTCRTRGSLRDSPAQSRSVPRARGVLILTPFVALTDSVLSPLVRLCARTRHRRIPITRPAEPARPIQVSVAYIIEGIAPKCRCTGCSHTPPPPATVTLHPAVPLQPRRSDPVTLLRVHLAFLFPLPLLVGVHPIIRRTRVQVRIALRPSKRRQPLGHHVVLPQLVRSSAKRYHALLLRAALLAPAHPCQVIVEHRPTVPFENTPTTFPVIPLPLSAKPAPADSVITRLDASSALVLGSDLSFMHLDMVLQFLQAAFIEGVIQLVAPLVIKLVQVLEVRLHLARHRPHQVPGIPLL